MSADVIFAKQYQLVPGVALTDAQMAQPTSDIVWLVEKAVTLADGTLQKVLTPQVYARLKEGDLGDNSTLLRAGMVQDPADYPWSSHGWNALGRTGLNGNWLQPHEEYLRLGQTSEARRFTLTIYSGHPKCLQLIFGRG